MERDGVGVAWPTQLSTWVVDPFLLAELRDQQLASASAPPPAARAPRSASPYISGHRGRTFVIVVPGEVVLVQVDLELELD